MKVKFTNPTNSNEVLFGNITGKTGRMFTILRETGVGKIYMVNPNDDYNFGFILSAKGEEKYAAKLDEMIDEEGNYIKNKRYDDEKQFTTRNCRNDNTNIWHYYQQHMK